MKNVYKENGYESRVDYLKSLAIDMGIDEKTVFLAANMLGENEDFDGLVTTLEDHVDGMEF